MRIAEAQRRRWRAYAAEIGFLPKTPLSASVRWSRKGPFRHRCRVARAVADDAGFPCPWLISSLCLFYQTRSK